MNHAPPLPIWPYHDDRNDISCDETVFDKEIPSLGYALRVH